MSHPVSIVVPSLDDDELLARSLPALLAEVERRSLDDEILVVDDTGRDVLKASLARSFPQVRVVSREENGGFAHALLTGVKAARHSLALCLNPDVVVRPGCLEPLVECMEQDVFAVVPRVLLNGQSEQIESLTHLDHKEGLVSVQQPGLESGEEPGLDAGPAPVAFAVGGACLLRCAEFLATDGFDPLYEPFYWEDVDLGMEAWRRGQRVLYQPAATVEHHHRGTIGRVVPRALVRAAQERNRFLFQWKHLDDPQEWQDHMCALYGWSIDAWLAGRRDELVWLAIALEWAEAALSARTRLGDAPLSFGEARRRSQGLED